MDHLKKNINFASYYIFNEIDLESYWLYWLLFPVDLASHHC